MKTFLGIILLVVSASAVAQDTTKKKTIEITSAFKPVLRSAAKINFNASPPALDAQRFVLKYDVPDQNMLFSYQSVPLQPVALPIDSAAAWENTNYIKLGLGSVTIPYIQAGFTFGEDKDKLYNIFVEHYNSKGSLHLQKNDHTAVGGTVTYKTKNNLEWNGGLGFQTDQYFLYGYAPDTLAFSKDQLRQRFQEFAGRVSLRNMEPTAYGLNYNPSLKVSVFTGKNDIHKATEANSVLNLPIQKILSKTFTVNLAFAADLTNYRPRDTATIQNNLFYFSPAVLVTTPTLRLSAGLIPSWDNKSFNLLPNFMADISTNDKRFTLQLGWIGYYEKGSYQRFASINPWLAQPVSLLNTRVDERYAGFKGSFLNHFTYSAKIGFVGYKQLPLFANDTTDGKTFLTLYSSSAESVQLHAEVGYLQGENFNATAKLTLNQYSKVKDQEKAWGLLPFQLEANLRWKILKDFWLTSELGTWSGAPYWTFAKESRTGDAAFDLSAGLEYKLNKKFNLWFQMNNLFNNKYERWHQYQVYGFNILGGVVFSFNQK